MPLTDQEDDLIDYLESQYNCHTVLLCGSRGLGTHTEQSDWDIVALHYEGPRAWCHDEVPGIGKLSAYIYPEQMAVYNPQAPSPLFTPLNYFVRLRDARVLVQDSNWGDTLIARAKEIYAQGTPPMHAAYRDHVRHQYDAHWMAKVMDTSLPQPVRDLCRHRMLHYSAEVYFMVRGAWIPPERQLLSAMPAADAEAFARAMQADASEEAIAHWVRVVFQEA